MKKPAKKILRWFLRVLLGIFGLFAILVIVFYLFRGKIIEKAINYVNDAQPGQVHLANINLRPFMNFPDISLQLKDLTYTCDSSSTGEIDSLPILRMEDVYVSLNIVKLIRGKYKVSSIRLGEGEINYIIGADSVSNIEKALGFRFGETDTTETGLKDSSTISLDLNSLQIRNLDINYIDIPGKTNTALRILGLESRFSYYPDTITAALMLQMEVKTARFDDIVLDRPRTVSFSSSLIFDQLDQKIILDRTMLDLKDALLEADGEISIAERNLELNFSAKNSGIELLNFLLSGVLDLDVIEQIGEGYIQFSGTASGSFDKHVPLVELNFKASDVGFHIKTINQSITDIGFEGYATNGTEKDLSGLKVSVDNFHVSFPEGSLDANLRFSILVSPEVLFDINGEAELSVLEQILKTEAVKNMKGSLKFDGHIDGKINRETGGFLEDAGALRVGLNDVSFSLPGNEIQNLSGELFVQEKSIGFTNMVMLIYSNELHIDGVVYNLLNYFIGFGYDQGLLITLSANELYPEKLTGDTLFSESVKDLSFQLGIRTTAAELEQALDENKMPEMNINLKHFKAKFPGIANISDLAFLLRVDENDIHLSKLEGNIGETTMNLDLQVSNYSAFLKKDSLANVGVSFSIGSRLINLQDLLTINNEFLILPQSFISEKMVDFRFNGKVETTVGELLNKKDLPNFTFTSNELRWNFREYPLYISNFIIDLETRDSLIILNKFQGKVGRSNFALQASVANLLDTSRVLAGRVELQSGLLDLNEIMNYELFAGQQSASSNGDIKTDSMGPPGLDQLKLPDLDLNIDIKELRYAGNTLFNLKGDMRVKPYKIFYFDKFSVQTETGGAFFLDGQFNISDPELYMLSASIEIDTVNVGDFDLQVTMGDTVYSLEDNFNGILSAKGIAEFYLNPDMSVNIDYSTAIFSVSLVDGRVRNFTPLHALAKFTGNKDLDNVKFGLLKNSFTLISGAVQIPLMSIESNLGLILLEGEQKLDGDFLYLARVPVKLIRGTAWNVLSNQQRKEAEETEVQQMQAQKFLLLTISGKNGQEEVKMGDKREKYE